MADRLLELLRGAVKVGTFTLSSGKSSDWYLDCREVTLTPEGSLAAGKRLIWEILLNNPSQIKPTGVVGPTTAACPLVTAVGIQAALIGWNTLKLGYVRKEPKGHGTGKLIEGAEFDAGDSVVVLDDVATSGGSLVRACKAVAQTGAVVLGCIVLVDRDEGARRALREWASAHRGDVTFRAFYLKEDLI